MLTKDQPGVESWPNGPASLAAVLRGPVARIVLAVAQQALLGPLGVDRVMVAVRHPGGRLELVSTDAAAYSHHERGFLWSEAAPLMGAMRTTIANQPSRIESSGESTVVSYATRAKGFAEEVVLAAVCSIPPAASAHQTINAYLVSAAFSILPESDFSIPDASIVVESRTVEDGIEASVAVAGVNDSKAVVRLGRTTPEAIANCTAALLAREATVRYSDQKAVDGRTVSLAVLDVAGCGSVLGATASSGTNVIGPAIAVVKASKACGRIAAETQLQPSPPQQDSAPLAAVGSDGAADSGGINPAPS